MPELIVASLLGTLTTWAFRIETRGVLKHAVTSRVSPQV
jgi:hypothetical protein